MMENVEYKITLPQRYLILPFILGILVIPYASSISEIFWSERFWLTPELSWKDFEGVNTNSYELLYPIPIALLLLLIRDVLVTHADRILGPVIRLKSNVVKKSLSNPELETVYKLQKNSNNDLIFTKGTELGLSERQTERWLRQRIKEDKPSKLEKLVETSWRCLYYTGMVIFGLTTLWDKPWLWDTRHCWYNLPNQQVNDNMWRYYMIGLTFYWSMLFSQIGGDSLRKRKDFWELLVHHICTILLFCFSWVINCVRIGMMVLMLHDTADAFLDAAKMFKYAKYQKTCDVFFGLFVVVWVITRLYLYPVYILYSTLFETKQFIGIAPSYYVMNGFLILLQILHFVWSYYIFKAAFKALGSGNVEKDTRSDSDSSD